MKATYLMKAIKEAGLFPQVWRVITTCEALTAPDEYGGKLESGEMAPGFDYLAVMARGKGNARLPFKTDAVIECGDGRLVHLYKIDQ